MNVKHIYHENISNYAAEKEENKKDFNHLLIE